MDAMPMNAKLRSTTEIETEAAEMREKGQRICFTNGCFDLLHIGHTRYLAKARSLGDILIVGLNTDASVRRIKGDKRPIIEEERRAEVLGALACVDRVVLFDDPAPLGLIRAIVPHVLVKGADWAESDIIGGDFVTSRGGKVARIALAPDASTSAIIERIHRRYRTG
ncbi:D-glycero-beta-D-manno-heptose 1-phosphate adenylyltransferase [bacterium DOLZORAL124_64_63]|nr:MAG: D-glycero-beta-D-manno-heptose 1-phosphate adenylyltransferase [bacterium DOLZORAL124_64_63]